MRTPITYYGGKQRMAGDIVSMIPPHKIYCEPFFGGGAVFFRKKKSGIEVINDHNNDLINFYSCCQNRFEELQDMVRQTLHSESIYMYAKDVYNNRVEVNEIEKAWAVWLITNGSFAGSMHGGWKWCNGSSGSHSAVMIRNKRNEFGKELKERLSDVQISCREALRVIEERDSENTFFYLDPPYPGSFQGHYRGYTHQELFELLQLLSSIKGKFILSNYWCQTLNFHIKKFGWNYKKETVQLSVCRLKGGKNQIREEILAWNYNVEKTLFDNVL